MDQALQALRALASLERSAQTAVDNIVRAGSEGGMGDKAKSGLAGLWDRTEPGRKLAEPVLAPFDIVAADHWIDLLKDTSDLISPQDHGVLAARVRSSLSAPACTWLATSCITTWHSSTTPPTPSATPPSGPLMTWAAGSSAGCIP
jgi:hypothetical protein